MRIKILPLTLSVALLFFTVKTADIIMGTQTLANGVLITRADAQADVEPPKKEIPGAEKEASAASASEDAKVEAVVKKNPAVSQTPGETVNQRLTPSETDLLKNLGKRREELRRWENNIQIKEAALNATEKRIDEKIGKIEAMQQEVSTLLAQYNAQEDAKIRSLVKIYESMKPKDAARIFDEVEMPILLLVIDKMAEKKAAPILAEMDSKKAKQVTVELAAQRRSMDGKLNNLNLPNRKP